MTDQVRTRRGRGEPATSPHTSPDSRGRKHRSDTATRPRGSWLARTRATLRLSLRQVRRTPGSTFLVVLLIALPITAMAGATVFYESHQPTTEQMVGARLGQNDAMIQPFGAPAEGAHQALRDPWSWTFTHQDETESSAATPPTALPQMVPASAKVTEVVSYFAVRLRTETGVANITGVMGPVWEKSFTPRFTLLEGRAPADASEVLVTPSLLTRLGAKVGDQVESSDGATTVLVTGTIEAALDLAGTDLIVMPDGGVLGDDAAASGQVLWYIDGWQPTLDQFRDLNAQGYAVLGRDLMLTQPNYPEGPTDALGSTAIPMYALLSAGGAFVAMIVGFVAGAALSVSARRQQRSLAMAASVGASRRDLFGVVIGQGLVLGVVAGIIGVGLGIGVTALLLTNDTLLGTAWGQVWGLHIPVIPVVALTLFAVLIAFLASLLPARAATRGDTLAALRGARRPVTLVKAMPRWGAGVLFVGLAASGIGLALLIVTITTQRSESLAIVAGVLVIVGPLLSMIGTGMCGHWLVTKLAALLGRAGIGTRLAARDAAANPARTVPAFLAISSAVFLAAAGLAVTAISAEGTARNYSWNSPLNTVTIWSMGNTPAIRDAGIAEAKKLIAGLNPTATATIGRGADVSFTAEGTLANPDEIVYSVGNYLGTDCPEVGCVNGIFAQIGQSIYVIDSADLETALDVKLTSGQLAAYRDGSAIGTSESLVHEEKATLFPATAAEVSDFRGNYSTDAPPRTPITLPAMLVEKGRSFADLAISPETAKSLGITWDSYAALGSLDEPLTVSVRDKLDADAMKFSDAAGDGTDGATGAYLSTMQESGPNSPLIWLILISVVTLVVVAGTSLVTLGLARFERRPDDATLTAVGGTKRVRRRVNVIQALIIVGIGSVLGAALGTIPALAFAVAGAPYFSAGDFPVLWIVGLAVGLPILLAAIAWLVPPTNPDLTRRTAIS